nr:MAG TPA: replication terminator protein [Caudoviricetes sp.]
MRNSIFGFSQNTAINYNLKLDDLLLLQYIMQANAEPGMLHILDENETCYVWLNHAKIQEDLPILSITEGTLKNKLSKLKTSGFINSKSVANKSARGTRTYYCITEKTMSLLNDMEITTSFSSDVKPGPRHSLVTSNNKLNNDNKLNTVISKDITEQSSSEIDLGFGESKPVKLNLYQQCLAIINDYTEDTNIKKMLIDYLDLLLEKMRNEHKVLYANQFKGMLKHLGDLVASKEGKLEDIISQSISKGYIGFFPANHNNNYSSGKNVTYRLPEQKIAKDEDKARDENGNFMVF